MRSDPIGDRYFRPLELADKASDLLFYATALLSFLVLFVERKTHPLAYDIVQSAFVLAVVILFVLNLVIRLHWRPRAEDKRRAELISNSSGVALTHERTSGYYNNEQLDPTRRLGAALLENSHFSKAIALEMMKFERLKVAAYAALFLVLLLNRTTDLAIASTAAQAVFSEQIISRWLRLEWFRTRCDGTFSQLYSLFQSDPNKTILYAKILELFAYYETSKSNAGVTLSSKIFRELNPKLSAEWDEIKLTLKI